MKIAIGVFAKTPELSPVKTRLAETFGEEQARAFYKLSVAATHQNLKDLKGIFNGLKDRLDGLQEGDPSLVDLSIYWALAEETGPESPFWEGKTCLWTGEGGLGERLHQVSRRLFETHDYVFVMGTDSPQVGTAVLKKALEKALKMDEKTLENSKKTVLGPCSDGGFYLFGMPRPLEEELWVSVSYSQEDTCQQLVERLTEKGFEIEKLPIYGDVDVEEDLRRLKKELLEAPSALNNEQRKLLSWLSTINPLSSGAQSPTGRLCE